MLFLVDRAGGRGLLSPALRQHLQGLSYRAPRFFFLIGKILHRRSMPTAYAQALVDEAGFGRLPVRIPGRMLPGLRHLGAVAVFGVALHYALWQTGPRTRRSGSRQAGSPAAAGRGHRQADGHLPYWLRAGANRKLPRPDSSA